MKKTNISTVCDLQYMWLTCDTLYNRVALVVCDLQYMWLTCDTLYNRVALVICDLQYMWLTHDRVTLVLYVIYYTCDSHMTLYTMQKH